MVHFLLGSKSTIYCMLLSVWGVIMLTLLGIFFKIRSPLLFDTMCYNDDCNKKWLNYTLGEIQENYDDYAINCWIAAALYAVLFVVAFIVYKWNSRLEVAN